MITFRCLWLKLCSFISFAFSCASFSAKESQGHSKGKQRRRFSFNWIVFHLHSDSFFLSFFLFFFFFVFWSLGTDWWHCAGKKTATNGRFSTISSTQCRNCSTTALLDKAVERLDLSITPPRQSHRHGHTYNTKLPLSDERHNRTQKTKTSIPMHRELKIDFWAFRVPD